MSFVIAFAAGILVGALYALLRVRSPAPPLIGLVGLLAMFLAQSVLNAVI
jgi:XapX domain-containing protein